MRRKRQGAPPLQGAFRVAPLQAAFICPRRGLVCTVDGISPCSRPSGAPAHPYGNHGAERSGTSVQAPNRQGRSPRTAPGGREVPVGGCVNTQVFENAHWCAPPFAVYSDLVQDEEPAKAANIHRVSPSEDARTTGAAGGKTAASDGSNEHVATIPWPSSHQARLRPQSTHAAHTRAFAAPPRFGGSSNRSRLLAPWRGSGARGPAGQLYTAQTPTPPESCDAAEGTHATGVQTPGLLASEMQVASAHEYTPVPEVCLQISGTIPYGAKSVRVLRGLQAFGGRFEEEYANRVHSPLALARKRPSELLASHCSE